MRTVLRLTEQDIEVIQRALNYNISLLEAKLIKNLNRARRKWNKIAKECKGGELCEIITTDASERR